MSVKSKSSDKEKFSAAILAGGQAKRFGGDKAYYRYKGKPLLAWVLESLAGAGERFIVANKPYPEFKVPIYADIIPGGDSLSGLHTALVHARYDWLALSACDLPCLSRDYWDYLFKKRGNAAVVMVGDDEDKLEPLAAFYHKSVLPLVKAQLSSSELSMGRIARKAAAKIIDRQEVIRRFGGSLFTNINQPSDINPERSRDHLKKEHC